MTRLFLIFSSIILVASCIKDNDFNETKRRNSYNQHIVNYSVNDNWSVRYMDRTIIDENNSHNIIDVFKTYLNNDMQTYYMDIISEKDLQEKYNGNIISKIKEEVSNLSTQNDLSSILYKGNNSFNFDRLSPGKWIAFIFGIDTNGSPTGSYSTTNFTITDEVPTKDYMKWLGSWSIGDKYIQYNINIQQADANYTYFITGWEGNNPNNNDLVFTTKFEKGSGDMLFVNRNLGNFTDNNDNFDIRLCGNFDIENDTEEGNTFIEGPSTIARCTLLSPNNASVKGSSMTIKLDNVKNYTFQFKSMQFKKLNEQNAYDIDEYVPKFPLEMNKFSTTRSIVNEKVYIRPTKAIRHINTNSIKYRANKQS